jgi:hypothetical protein
MNPIATANRVTGAPGWVDASASGISAAAPPTTMASSQVPCRPASGQRDGKVSEQEAGHDAVGAAAHRVQGSGGSGRWSYP